MLAGIKEKLQVGNQSRVEEEMTAIDALLEGLIDYAGLFPPAGLGMPAAARNFLDYSRSKHSRALGRFIVDAGRVLELRQVAAARISQIKLSLVANANTEWDSISRLFDSAAQVETLEVKAETPQEIECIVRRLPLGLTTHFEVPVGSQNLALLDAICAAGARVKLRMGGVAEHAFPSPAAAAGMIQALAERHLMFKATAGLHHPLRSSHPLTYDPDSPVAMMHGFVNLFCAAALIHLGGEEEDAGSILSETDPETWRVSSEAIAWKSFHLSAEQIREVRRDFFVSFGSCSFTEPIEDLEALGWL